MQELGRNCSSSLPGRKVKFLSKDNKGRLDTVAKNTSSSNNTGNIIKYESVKFRTWVNEKSSEKWAHGFISLFGLHTDDKKLKKRNIEFEK